MLRQRDEVCLSFTVDEIEKTDNCAGYPQAQPKGQFVRVSGTITTTAALTGRDAYFNMIPMNWKAVTADGFTESNLHRAELDFCEQDKAQVPVPLAPASKYRSSTFLDVPKNTVALILVPFPDKGGWEYKVPQ